VIRDVLIFTTPNTTEPDESDKTTWELKAKVYFDIATLKETGILTLKSNSDPSQSVSIRIALSSAGTNKHSISITIPVIIDSIIIIYEHIHCELLELELVLFKNDSGIKSSSLVAKWIWKTSFVQFHFDLHV